MSCSKPLLFVDYGTDELGKRHLKMLPYRADVSLERLISIHGEKNILFIPCGKCPGCVQNYRRQWALRCEAEAKCHDISCFITLTYDNDHNPGVVIRHHLQDFIRKLRRRGIKIRYFGCGEYGETGLRSLSNQHPHYHLILFGYMPDDLKFIGKSKTSQNLFKSKFIENLWSKGLCTVQEFESGCAGYVAGYVDKKADQRDSFLIMSRGLGRDYYMRNIMKLYETDNYVAKNGFVANLPRYADKCADQFFYDLSDVKENRLNKSKKMTLANMVAHGFTRLSDVWKYAGELEARRKKYARSL